jgi:hypothetical protein
VRSRWEQLAAAMARHKVLTGIGAFILLSIIVYAVNPHAADNTNGAAPPPAPTATHAGAATPSASSESATTTVRRSTFPPKTLATFRAFAATGDASQIHEIGHQEDGLASCPEPNIYVTVSRVITGRTLEADLSAFFMQNGLIGNRCQEDYSKLHVIAKKKSPRAASNASR